ncbi:OmpA family protein [Flavihumibacter petaseus NBRC 106054]|uniref:OmpA family protein n=2 Tax=Flavihumibacter TaxID=1004301 RepID=A0A0E9N1R2_9BACT|nr:OmpA family protein [Flavihumibacter petaseus NBRC 106054]
MKKLLLSLTVVTSVLGSVTAQNADYKKRPAIGIHFITNDFVTPQRIKETSLTDVLKDKQWAKFGEMDYGFGISYLKGLSNKIDFSTTLGVSFLSYPLKDNPSNGDDGALLEWDAMVRAKMTSDKYWVSPYISAGIGASKWRGYYGAIIPVGLGIQVNFFDEAFLLLETQYRTGITSTTSNHFFNSLGIAGNIGKPKEEKVVPQPPLPMVALDEDKDGVVDSLDACPTVPGLPALQGCPDRDGDGIADKDDKCPDTPGIAKYQGCPIPDTDGDGINDEEDKCPTVAGVAKYEGCPIPDRDNDGVNDDEDRCPDIAGPADNGGCPKLETSKFNAAAVQFVTGSATLTAAAKRELDKAARILNEQYPTVNVEIAGHTDNTGSAPFNQKLSEKRAAAVKTYLVKKKVSADRLTAVGFGQDQPIGDNKSASGKAQNRRVEFKVSQ